MPTTRYRKTFRADKGTHRFCEPSKNGRFVRRVATVEEIDAIETELRSLGYSVTRFSPDHLFARKFPQGAFEYRLHRE